MANARDLRKPAEVTEAFRLRLASALVPLGFEVKAKGAKLVRKSKQATHRIELSSSHRNVPGDVTCWVAFFYEDKPTRAGNPQWVAGGGLGSGAFDDGQTMPCNIAQPEEAAALVERVLGRLEYFDLLDSPSEVLHVVCRGYVAGLIDPLLVVPFLRAHLGTEAVRAYAGALLQGRQELWPAFVGTREDARVEHSLPLLLDHGSQLAIALTGVEELEPSEAPFDVVPSAERAAKALRSHFGLQLRAWGETEAAGLLRRTSDTAVTRTYSEMKGLPDSSVDSQGAARLVLRLAIGEERTPRSSAPHPRFFQNYAGHTSFCK